MFKKWPMIIYFYVKSRLYRIAIRRGNSDNLHETIYPSQPHLSLRYETLTFTGNDTR